MIRAEYIDHMGDDLRVANAARVSFAKHHDVLVSGDKRLIHFLAQHDPIHWTPYAHCWITLRVAAPIFVRTHCFKHKIGYVESEESRRYITEMPEMFIPAEWRSAAPDKKQGSGPPIKSEAHVIAESIYRLAMDTARGDYARLLELGVCPEQARMVLPQSMMTEWYWTGSLYAYARFYQHRHAPDVQGETTELAEKVARIIAPLYPVAWPALMNGLGVYSKSVD